MSPEQPKKHHMQRTRAEDEVSAKLGHVPNSPRKLWVFHEQTLRAHP